MISSRVIFTAGNKADTYHDNYKTQKEAIKRFNSLIVEELSDLQPEQTETITIIFDRY